MQRQHHTQSFFLLLVGMISCASLITTHTSKAQAQDVSCNGTAEFPCSFQAENLQLQRVPALFKFQSRVSQAKLPLGEAVFQTVVVKLLRGTETLCLEEFSNVTVLNSVLNLEIGANMSCEMDEVIAENSNLSFQVCLGGQENCLRPLDLAAAPYAVKSSFASQSQNAYQADKAGQAHYAHRVTADRDLLLRNTLGTGYFDFYTHPAEDAALIYDAAEYLEYANSGFIQWTPLSAENALVVHIVAKDPVTDQLRSLEKFVVAADATTLKGSLTVETGGATINGDSQIFGDTRIEGHLLLGNDTTTLRGFIDNATHGIDGALQITQDVTVDNGGIHVNGDSDFAGNVGVNTNVPGYSLDVNGDLNFTGQLRRNGEIIALQGAQWEGVEGGDLYYTAGNIGIGTNSPNSTLDVNGDINFTGQLVRNGVPLPLTPWSDNGDSISYGGVVEASSFRAGSGSYFFDLTIDSDGTGFARGVRDVGGFGDNDGMRLITNNQDTAHFGDDGNTAFRGEVRAHTFVTRPGGAIDGAGGRKGLFSEPDPNGTVYRGITRGDSMTAQVGDDFFYFDSDGDFIIPANLEASRVVTRNGDNSRNGTLYAASNSIDVGGGLSSGEGGLVMQVDGTDRAVLDANGTLFLGNDLFVGDVFVRNEDNSRSGSLRVDGNSVNVGGSRNSGSGGLVMQIDGTDRAVLDADGTLFLGNDLFADAVFVRNDNGDEASMFRSNDTLTVGTNPTQAPGGLFFAVNGSNLAAIGNDGTFFSGRDVHTNALFVDTISFQERSGVIDYRNNQAIDATTDSGVAFFGNLTLIDDDGDLLVNDFIYAQEYRNHSDARIKNIIGRSDSHEDLQTLMKIEITDYTKKDNRKETSQKPVKKVIAQQIRSIYPDAVDATTSHIPDIFVQSTSIQTNDTNELTVTISKPHQLQRGDWVSIEHEGRTDHFKVIATPNSKTFVVENFKTKPEQVFVYGRVVNDFLTVDYNALAMLGISATQEIAKRSASMREDIDALKAELKELRAENKRLSEKVDQFANLKDEVDSIRELCSARQNDASDTASNSDTE